MGAFPQQISCFRVDFRNLLTILRKGYAGGSKTLPKQANTIEDTAMQQKALKKTHSSDYITDFGSRLDPGLIYISIIELDTPFLKTIVDLQQSNVMRLRRDDSGVSVLVFRVAMDVLP